MDLTAQLGRLRSIEDLSGLLASLGHEPLFEPVPSSSLARRGEPRTPVFAVARAGDFPWFALAGPAPERLAPDGWRAGSRLGAGSAGVLGARSGCAEDSRSRWRSTACPRWSSRWTRRARRRSPRSPGSPARGADGALAYAARAADALSGEEVGRRFFREFKATLERMTDAPAHGAPA